MSHRIPIEPASTTSPAETTLQQLRGLVAILSPTQALDREARDCLALLLEELVERLSTALPQHCSGCCCEGSPQATA